MNESAIQAAVVKKLRDAGWFVKVTSQDKAVRRQSAGLPDVLAWRGNHSLLIECKTPGGKLRCSQIEFRININPHEGLNLRYLIISDPDQVEVWK